MSNEIILWDKKYSTGIDLIDEQHKELIVLTNKLYAACFAADSELEGKFKDAMSKMVKYVQYHFDAELKLLAAIEYPKYEEHKRMHVTLIKKILDSAKSHDEGKKFVPNNFVRTLVDWVFGHIAVYDKQYSAFAEGQLKNGKLSLQKLKEIEKASA